MTRTEGLPLACMPTAYVSTHACAATQCPRQDSNLRSRLRRPVLYPLSYEGPSPTCHGTEGIVPAGRSLRWSQDAVRYYRAVDPDEEMSLAAPIEVPHGARRSRSRSSAGR